MPPNDCLEQLDAARRRHGFLTIDEMLQRLCPSNTVFDLFSTLVSSSATIGTGNVFYPGTVILCQGGSLQIGSNNRFHMQSTMAAENGGAIVIGDDNEFGEGGFIARANRPGARIEIGSGGRYLHGAAIYGDTRLGSGSQVIGAIIVENCMLAAGARSTEPDAARRGGVLKGHGTAKGLKVDTGEVIAGAGRFNQADVEQQAAYHPKHNDKEPR